MRYSREKLRILLGIDPQNTDMNKRGLKRKDGDYAIAWVQSYGKGRVFYCSLGHNESVFWNPVASVPDTIGAEDRQRLERRFAEAIPKHVVAPYRKLHAFIRDTYMPATRDTVVPSRSDSSGASRISRK